MKQKFCCIFCLLILVASCVTEQKSKKRDLSVDTLQLLYAEGFQIYNYPHYKEVVVLNPWQKGLVFARYYLVDDEAVVIPSDGVKVLVPVQNLAVTSSTHFEFLGLLHELSRVQGVCSPELIYNPFLREQFALGNISDLGDAFNINVEKTLKLNPDRLMMSGYKQDDPYAKRVIQAGIPVVYNNEWMENSLLARAEWIKFVAVFFQKEQQADSIFNQVKDTYLSIKSQAQSVAQKPKIMSGSNFRGTWYMPGGGSFMAQLFADAGGDYFYVNDTTKGSLPLTVETVLMNFSNTDVWLNCNYATVDELVKTDRKHALFQPVVTKRVYNFNKSMLPSGANDYWESAVARPDLLLRDVISILHPGILPEHQLIFAEQLR
ncbi:MAG: ABC transporter substrate-binding protein [Paludibacter sp.]|nr:ABC transporter substrate-binding protein [Paludibacter sp.]